MEYLSRILKCMSLLSTFRFHRMCKTLQLTHLIFADKLMVFWKGANGSVIKIKETLTHFSIITGLVANKEKSNIFLAGMKDSIKSQLISLTGFSQGTFPIIYVGLPLFFKKWPQTRLSHADK